MNESNEPEDTLVGRCRDGDADAFRTLVEKYSRMLFVTAYLMTRDRGMAEDAVQSALVKMWQKLPSLRRNDSFKAWLARIVVNEVNRQRRKKRPPTVPIDESPEVPNDPPEMEAAIFHDEESRRLRQALDVLPSGQREAVVLRYFSDLTVPEVAAATGEREGTVKSRLSRALDRLGEVLGKDEMFQDRRQR